MLQFIDFATFGDPRRARENFWVSVVLGVLALGLLYFKERALAASCVGMIGLLWRASGKGVPPLPGEDTDPQAKTELPPVPPVPPAAGSAVVGGVLACLLFSLMSCGTVSRTPKHDLADAIDGNAADLAAFGKWDEKRQTDILARCKATNTGATACTRRLKGYQETRDAMRLLLKKQIHTLDEAIKLLGDSPEGRL